MYPLCRQGETRKANLDMLAEKAAAYASTSYRGLFHFVRYIEKLKKYDTDFGEASLGDESNSVRIMSIHKSKGLEFPVVFLAGMGKKFNKQDAYGQLLLDADLGAAADEMDLNLRTKAPTLKKMAIRRRMELESMGEELRVLYVAMTRAKEVLVMTGTDRSLENKLEKMGSALLNRWTDPLYSPVRGKFIFRLGAYGKSSSSRWTYGSKTGAAYPSDRQRTAAAAGKEKCKRRVVKTGYKTGLR